MKSTKNEKMIGIKTSVTNHILPLPSKGQKYMKIIDGTSVWGFVSMKDGVLKGSPFLWEIC